MSPWKISVAFLLAFCCASVGYAQNLTVEEGPLSAEELSLLQTMAKHDKEFHYSKNARRYFRIGERGVKLPVRIELIFERKDGLYFGKYIGYDVSIEPNSSIVNYSFDAGTAWRGEGTAMITAKGVVRIEKGCGTGGCEIQVFRNAKLLYEGNM